MKKIDFDRDDLFDLDDHFFSLQALGQKAPGFYRGIRESLLDTRRFCREYLAPRVLEEDRKNAADPHYISWDLVRLAGRHGQLSNYLPRFLGGSAKGNPALMGPIMEEQAAVDTAYCGMLGGHGLGLTALMMTLNMRVLQEVADKIVAAEKSERPYLIDCAITEPSAGTDVEEVELYPKARLACSAKKTADGAILNGRKCFISTGHMATEHVVLIPFDLKDPVKSYGCFLVPGDAPGFALGRKERKMGHLISTVSELIFEDCFVPQENIVVEASRFANKDRPPHFELLLELVLGVTRTAVGAMGTGCARGSLERAVALARTTKHRGRTIINQQWAQALLTNMFMNVMTARAIYLESTYALLINMAGGRAGSIPWFMNTDLMRKIFATDWFKKFFHSRPLQNILFYFVNSAPPEARARIQFMSSLAKVVGTDMAMENAQLAVEFGARAGLRHDAGIEKGFRDAKLLQIFEGTNQLNRLNIFKNFYARRLPGVEVF